MSWACSSDRRRVIRRESEREKSFKNQNTWGSRNKKDDEQNIKTGSKNRHEAGIFIKR
jgi:hypothetical protein